MTEEMLVHGVEWTTKELFVYPNEFIYWSVQIVMYPYMTGLVAGAFVLSSLYHVFGQAGIKDMARFSLVFSMALLPAAGLPLLLHLQQPLRALNPLLTPHFTSAIAAFGIVFSTYAMIVLSEIWFVYRQLFVERMDLLRDRPGLIARGQHLMYRLLCLGAHDISEQAIALDKRATTVLAAIGIPVACFLHGYAGFIFGSVKANALWMSPLMPVIFIMSAIVSGIALCMLTYTMIMEWQVLRLRLTAKTPENRQASGQDQKAREMSEATTDVLNKTVRYLLGFLVAAITLELLDLIFRGYTALKSWDILRSVMYGKDFANIFILQYGLGNLVPFVLLLLPNRTTKRTVVALVLVLFGVFMMRWNVVIGGQAFSLSFAGYMHYHLPLLPHNLETYKEGLLGAFTVGATPFVLFWIINKIVPAVRTFSGDPGRE